MSTTTKNYQILQKLEGEGNYLKLHPETNAAQVITSDGSNVQAELGARYTKTETDALLNTKVNNDDLGNWNFESTTTGSVLNYYTIPVLERRNDHTIVGNISGDIVLTGAGERPLFLNADFEVKEIALLEDVNTKANSTDVYTKQESDAKYPSLANGIIPQSYLPSYVDDVIEGYYYNTKFYKEAGHATEITGESGKIYVDLDTNKTYRWSGSTFVVISETLALGETSSTAYAGDKGKKLSDDVLQLGNDLGALEQDVSNLESGVTAAGKAKALDHDVNIYIDSDTLTGSDEMSNFSSSELHLNVELKPTGVLEAGVLENTYSCVTVDQYGRATAGGQIVEVGATGQTTPSSTLAIGGLFFKEI